MADIRDIAVIYNQGDYQGEKPVGITAKPFDVAYDTRFGKMWEYDGQDWLPVKYSTACDIILGSATTVNGRIYSPDTVIPPGIYLFQGDDNSVPDALRLSPYDLAIHHSFHSTDIVVRLYALDTVSGVYKGITVPAASTQTTDSGNWTLISNLQCLAGLDKIKIILSTAVQQEYVQIPGGGGGGVLEISTGPSTPFFFAPEGAITDTPPEVDTPLDVVLIPGESTEIIYRANYAEPRKVPVNALYNAYIYFSGLKQYGNNYLPLTLSLEYHAMGLKISEGALQYEASDDSAFCQIPMPVCYLNDNLTAMDVQLILTVRSNNTEEVTVKLHTGGSRPSAMVRNAGEQSGSNQYCLFNGEIRSQDWVNNYLRKQGSTPPDNITIKATPEETLAAYALRNSVGEVVSFEDIVVTIENLTVLTQGVASLSQELNNHVFDLDIHVTPTEKLTWNEKGNLKSDGSVAMNSDYSPTHPQDIDTESARTSALNFLSESMRTFVTDNYLSIIVAATTYLTQEDASRLYTTVTDFTAYQTIVSTTYLTKDDATVTYQLKLGYTAENIANKTTTVKTTDTSNTLYTTEKAVRDALDALGTSIGATYVTQADFTAYQTTVSTTYLTVSNAAGTYLTIAEATAAYQPKLGYTTENVANKVTAVRATGTATDTAYPSEKAVRDALTSLSTTISSIYLTTATAGTTYLTIANAASTYLTTANASSTYQIKLGYTAENVTNKVTTVRTVATATDTAYPSEKAVATAIAGITSETVHNNLTGRNAANAHPTSAIQTSGGTDLQTNLDSLSSRIGALYPVILYLRTSTSATAGTMVANTPPTTPGTVVQAWGSDLTTTQRQIYGFSYTTVTSSVVAPNNLYSWSMTYQAMQTNRAYVFRYRYSVTPFGGSEIVIFDTVKSPFTPSNTSYVDNVTHNNMQTTEIALPVGSVVKFQVFGSVVSNNATLSLLLYDEDNPSRVNRNENSGVILGENVLVNNFGTEMTLQYYIDNVIGNASLLLEAQLNG